MAELDDLRGRAIAWQMPCRNPLRCTIEYGAETLGTLIQEERSVRARLAGVWWRITPGYAEDKVAFDDGPLIVARAHQPFLGRYETWVDRTDFYILLTDPDGQRVRWRTGLGHTAIVFRRHRFSSLGETGEIAVSETSILEHAPVLILLGLIRMSRWPIFRTPSSRF